MHSRQGYGRFVLPSLPAAEYAALQALRRHLNASQLEIVCAAIRLACSDLAAITQALEAFRMQAPSETPRLLPETMYRTETQTTGV